MTVQFDHFVRHVRKIAKRTISFVMSVRPYVRMEQLGNRWTKFHEILHLSMCIFECVWMCARLRRWLCIHVLICVYVSEFV